MGETPALLLPARDMLLPARDRGDASPLSRGEVPEEEASDCDAEKGACHSCVANAGRGDQGSRIKVSSFFQFVLN